MQSDLDLAKTELIKEAWRRKIKTPHDLVLLKNKISEKFKIPSLPNYGLIEIYRDLIKKGEIKRDHFLEKLFKKAKIRTLSGVAIVSVLTFPYRCPGKCLYCPSEKDMPKSYLSNEPAVMRAILCNFDPYKQVQVRLHALEQAGHDISKIELIVMGGSFNALPIEYQYWFVEECYRACNDFDIESQKSTRLPDGQEVKSQKLKSKVKSLKNIKNKLIYEQKRNEKARYRVVGLTLETRPDLIDEEEILKFREMGCTKVEIGVQSIYDDILEKNKRGHGVKETIQATKLLKDAGFKVLYHMMPNLWGSDLEKDCKMFKEIFSNPNFQPDLIKIYPCVVTKDSELYDLWKKGGYVPYTDKELFNLLIKIKKIVPPYVRISRLIRDIPEESIIAGNKRTNLRQLIANHSQLNNWRCKCIRCREIRDNENSKLKTQSSKPQLKVQSLRLDRIDYRASKGREIFLQYVDQDDRLYSLLRLRISDGKAIIREVHTYGEIVNVGARYALPSDVSQHKGLGKKLIREAEKIAKDEFGCAKIAVIAGVGVREYYRKMGYRLKETYMVKRI